MMAQRCYHVIRNCKRNPTVLRASGKDYDGVPVLMEPRCPPRAPVGCMDEALAMTCQDAPRRSA